MYSAREVLWYYRQYGLVPVLLRVLRELSIISLALGFAIVDRVTASTETSICILPQESSIDQDTIALVSQTADDEELSVYITVDPQIAQHQNTQLFQEAEKYDIEFLQKHSLKFVWVLAHCGIVVFKDRLWQYRVLGSSDTRFIRVPHGVPAKAPKVPNDSRCLLRDVFLDHFTFKDNYRYTVASDLEFHREIGIKKRDKNKLAIYGYPRFDRIRHLVSNPEDEILSKTTREVLDTEENHSNILYAPTHKDDVYETTVFPFPDYNSNKLQEFLSRHNIRIFLRLHIREENSGIYNEYVDNETIFYAGHEFSGSAVEMMPYMDALVTDYSSIFLDYVLFDRPIFFVQDDIDAFRKLRGFVFDYDTYWPGPKITTQDQFLKILTNVLLQENDSYSYERQFVRDTFHPPKSEGFLENILEST